MKIKDIFVSMIIAALLSELVFASCINCCHATSSFAPTWLKEGIYARYTYPAGTLKFPNTSSRLGFDFVEFLNAVFRWECVDLTDTMAKIKVELNFTEILRNGKAVEDKKTQLTTEIYVDIMNRRVYLENGTLIGTTHLWLPANPTPNEDIVLWDVPPDKVTLKPSNTTTRVLTPQGIQKAFRIDGSVKIGGSSASFHTMCDYDTGVMCHDYPRGHEPAFKALDILQFIPNTSIFEDTNIDLGPSDDPIDLRMIFILVVIPVIFAIVFVAIYMRRRKPR